MSPKKSAASMDVSPVDGVINQIQDIINQSIKDQSPVGYFAALYKRVTRAIRQAIIADKFEDGPRMVKFDVQFAGHYFAAVKAHRNGGTIRETWKTAFLDKDGTDPLIILQHLMTAMNAHINLDLCQATAEVGGASLQSLHNDFVAVNNVLASQVPGVLKELYRVSPVLRTKQKWINDARTGFVKAALIGFREDSWKFASQLSAQPKTKQTKMLAQRDTGYSFVGGWYTHPTPFDDIIDEIRAKESSNIVDNIEVMDQIATKLSPLPAKLFSERPSSPARRGRPRP
jgi:hypothetical protein